MGDRNESIVRVLDERRGAFDITYAVDQPVEFHLQDTRDLREAVDSRPRRAATQDVVDEGTIDPGHLGNMGRAQAELVGTGMETVGERVVDVHVIPKKVWIK